MFTYTDRGIDVQWRRILSWGKSCAKQFWCECNLYKYKYMFVHISPGYSDSAKITIWVALGESYTHIFMNENECVCKQASFTLVQKDILGGVGFAVTVRLLPRCVRVPHLRSPLGAVVLNHWSMLRFWSDVKTPGWLILPVYSIAVKLILLNIAVVEKPCQCRTSIYCILRCSGHLSVH